jgi:hypothetical protein
MSSGIQYTYLESASNLEWARPYLNLCKAPDARAGPLFQDSSIWLQPPSDDLPDLASLTVVEEVTTPGRGTSFLHFSTRQTQNP